MKTLVLSISLAAMLIPVGASAGDAAAGKTKIATCQACHGADGIGTIDIYPNIAGQKAAYLESSMKAYRDGQRTSANAALMKSMVGSLSDQDIADLAAYYSGLSVK